MGRTFTLKGSISPDGLQAVARRVDEQLRELQRTFPASPLADLAILAALNLAYECLESKRIINNPCRDRTTVETVDSNAGDPRLSFPSRSLKGTPLEGFSEVELSGQGGTAWGWGEWEECRTFRADSKYECTGQKY